MRNLIFALSMLSVGVGCHSAEQPDVRPDAMSADAHREEAARAEAEAAKHRAAYDPAAREDFGVAPTSPSFGPVAEPAINPTRVELDRAAQLRKHAQAHEAAAKQLEAFEDAACAQIPPPERGACPLLGPVATVTEIPTGLRITLAHPELTATVLARMRCHLAFAKTRAFDVPSCPLYVRTLDIEPGPTPGSIELRGGTPAAIEEIRRRAPEELSIPGPPSAAR